MEVEPWDRFAAAWGQKPNALRSRSVADTYMGFEEVDDGGEVESRGEFTCPFCSEDFDIVDLWPHIEGEHPVESRNGVCPICEDRVGMDMVGHMKTQHENVFTMQHRSHENSGSHYVLSLLKKELQERHIEYLLGGSSYTVPANAALDPLLLSFVSNFAIVDPVKDDLPQTSDEETAVSNILDSQTAESIEPPLSDKEHEEKTRRSHFVQELMLSTIYDGSRL